MQLGLEQEHSCSTWLVQFSLSQTSAGAGLSDGQEQISHLSSGSLHNSNTEEEQTPSCQQSKQVASGTHSQL